MGEIIKKGVRGRFRIYIHDLESNEPGKKARSLSFSDGANINNIDDLKVKMEEFIKTL